MKARPPFREARVCACGDMGFVGLTRGRVALVDAPAVPLIAGNLWCAGHSPGKEPYAIGRVDGRRVSMHRYLTDAPEGSVVDHQSRDTLDNRDANLRPCSNAENSRNRIGVRGKTSPFKGVSFDSQNKRWLANIMLAGKCLNLGRYRSQAEAAHAYDRAAVEHFGAFALTNSALGLLPMAAE